jgi:hypothetical protein
MSLDEGCTPPRLCRRLGKSKAWVRTRMSLTVVAEHQSGPHPVFTEEDPPQSRVGFVATMVDEAGAKAHVSESCHAILVRRPFAAWTDGSVRAQEVCSDPDRHAPDRVAAGEGSPIASEAGASTSPRPGDCHAKRKGRVARIAHATKVFARSRGGVTKVALDTATAVVLVTHRDRNGDTGRARAAHHARDHPSRRRDPAVA